MGERRATSPPCAEAFQLAPRTTPALAAGLEEAGYRALWVGGSPGGDLEAIEQLLAATSRLVVATGIVNIWKDDATTIAGSARRLTARFPGRFLLGLGVGHPERASSQYERPYEALVQYLDALDEAGVGPAQRVLAALGPRVLRLAAEHTRGAHPYLVPPEHTRRARAVLGDGVLLAPEHKVVLDGDGDRGRALARLAASPYLSLVNYVNNLVAVPAVAARRYGVSTSRAGTRLARTSSIASLISASGRVW